MVAIIFDMDGVIVDSERYWEKNVEDILADTVESDSVSFDDVRGMNVMDQYDHLSDAFTISVTKDEYFTRYDEKAEQVYTEKVELMDGFTEILAQLQSRGIPVAIASSSFRHWIQMVLDRFDLHAPFTAVVSAEDIDGRSKPAPDIYLYTAEQIGADPADCVVIEDSTHGIEAAKNAGMAAVGFRTEMNQQQDLSQADIVLEGATALQRFIANEEYKTLIGDT